jgi:hypothetical protein
MCIYFVRPNYLSILIGTRVITNLWGICKNLQLGHDVDLNQLFNELCCTHTKEEYDGLIRMGSTLFILFSVASQIRLFPETQNYTKQILVLNWYELQCVQWIAVHWIELESHRFLCWDHIIVWFPEIKEATLNTIIPNNIRVSI